MVSSITSKKLCGKIECSNCYSRSFVTHPKALYWSSKNNLDPIYVHKSSNKKFWFDCVDCGHEIDIALNKISSGGWCSYCNKDKICYSTNCKFCYTKSFASHPMAIKWSLKNEDIPRNTLKGSDKKYWFDCSECGHDFESRLYSVTENHCPYCSNQKLCNNTECIICLNKSCASHKIKDAWSTKNEIKPREVFLQSNKKYIFNCVSCTHEYETTANHYYNRNGSCPYCSNKNLCYNDCDICYNKSFASHHLIACWSSKNTINPRNIFKGSETKCIFNCNICNSEFDSKLYNVLTGYWCPYCKNKSEAKLLECIKSNYIDYKTQIRFDWCRFSKTGNIMPFDFMVNNILIELDGEQHFSQISNWESPELTQQKDIEKIKYCIKNGYSIIHIYQKEVWNDIYNWKQVIQEAIAYLKSIEEPEVLFISYCNKYESHIAKLDSSIKYIIIKPEI